MTAKPNRAERRETTRALRRAEKQGCDCCGKPLSRLLPSLVLRTAAGMKIVHAACPWPPSAVCVSLVSAEVCKVNPDIEGDRIWFEAHPGAEYRFRKALPEEWERWAISQVHGALRNGLSPIQLADCPEADRFMAVRQLEPGKRARLPWIGSRRPTDAEMAEQFKRSFSNKSGVGMDAAAIAATVAAKAVGIIEHDMIDVAMAEGESLSAIKH